MVREEYLSVNKHNQELIKIKGSKFFATLFPMEEEAELKAIIQELRAAHPSANHHCFAYRINPSNLYERASDDGEPSGTAGKPILGQLISKDLINVGLVVTRIFGGTKLGTGGLKAAYKEAAEAVIFQNNPVRKNIYREILLQCPVESSYKLHEFLGQTESNILQSDFKGMVNLLKVQVALKDWARLDEWLKSFDNRDFEIVK